MQMSSHGAVVPQRCVLMDEFRHPEGFGNKFSTDRAIPNGNDDMNSTNEQLLLSAKGTIPARLPNASAFRRGIPSSHIGPAHAYRALRQNQLRVRVFTKVITPQRR